MKLSTFAKKVEALAKKNNRTYYSVSVNLSHHIRDKKESDQKDLMFSCYIDGFSHMEQRTTIDCLEKMENLINPPPKPEIPEVEI